MKYVIRALGWLSRLIWIAVILLPITFGLSMEKLFQPDIIGFGEITTSFSNGKVRISMPFYINNTGYYDLSDVNLTTVLKDSEGRIIAQGETLLPLIVAGNRIDAFHDVYVSLDKLTEDMEYLLLNDTMLDLNASFSLRFAYILKVSLHTNLTIPWGAPLHNLTISKLTYDLIKGELTLYASFENHSPLTLEGNLQVIIYNNRSETIGDQSISVKASSGELFLSEIKIPVEFSKITQNGYVLLYFGAEEFTTGPVKKEWRLSG